MVPSSTFRENFIVALNADEADNSKVYSLKLATVGSPEYTLTRAAVQTETMMTHLTKLSSTSRE